MIGGRFITSDSGFCSNYNIHFGEVNYFIDVDILSSFNTGY